MTKNGIHIYLSNTRIKKAKKTARLTTFLLKFRKTRKKIPNYFFSFRIIGTFEFIRFIGAGLFSGWLFFCPYRSRATPCFELIYPLGRTYNCTFFIKQKWPENRPFLFNNIYNNAYF